MRLKFGIGPSFTDISTCITSRTQSTSWGSLSLDQPSPRHPMSSFASSNHFKWYFYTTVLLHIHHISISAAQYFFLVHYMCPIFLSAYFYCNSCTLIAHPTEHVHFISFQSFWVLYLQGSSLIAVLTQALYNLSFTLQAQIIVAKTVISSWILSGPFLFWLLYFEKSPPLLIMSPSKATSWQKH